MNTYAVYKTDINDLGKTPEMSSVVLPTAYVKGLENVWKYCGGKLHRERAGYCGIIGRYEYSAIRVD